MYKEEENYYKLLKFEAFLGRYSQMELNRIEQNYEAILSFQNFTYNNC